MNAPLTKSQLDLLMSESYITSRDALPDYYPHAHPGRAPTLLARLGASWSAWRHRRAVLAELSGLTDRELADIGLHRADLGRVFDPAFSSAAARR